MYILVRLWKRWGLPHLLCCAKLAFPNPLRFKRNCDVYEKGKKGETGCNPVFDGFLTCSAARAETAKHYYKLYLETNFNPLRREDGDAALHAILMTGYISIHSAARAETFALPGTLFKFKYISIHSAARTETGGRS